MPIMKMHAFTPSKALPIAMPGTHEAFLEFFLKHEQPPARVLDLGAGQGALTLKLLQTGFTVGSLRFLSRKFQN